MNHQPPPPGGGAPPPPPQQPPPGYGPPPPPGYGPPPPPGYGPPQQYGTFQEEPSKGLAVAALVLGIISLAIFCVWFVAIPCGITAIILGGISISKCNRGESAGKGMATAGLVLGIIAISIAVVLVIIFSVSMTSSPELFEQMQNQ